MSTSSSGRLPKVRLASWPASLAVCADCSSSALLASSVAAPQGFSATSSATDATASAKPRRILVSGCPQPAMSSTEAAPAWADGCSVLISGSLFLTLPLCASLSLSVLLSVSLSVVASVCVALSVFLCLSLSLSLSLPLPLSLSGSLSLSPSLSRALSLSLSLPLSLSHSLRLPVCLHRPTSRTNHPASQPLTFHVESVSLVSLPLIVNKCGCRCAGICIVAVCPASWQLPVIAVHNLP